MLNYSLFGVAVTVRVDPVATSPVQASALVDSSAVGS
jgi:hypothetical protein